MQQTIMISRKTAFKNGFSTNNFGCIHVNRCTFLVTSRSPLCVCLLNKERVKYDDGNHIQNKNESTSVRHRESERHTLSHLVDRRTINMHTPKSLDEWLLPVWSFRPLESYRHSSPPC